MNMLTSNGEATGAVEYLDKIPPGQSTSEINKMRGRQISMISKELMTPPDSLYTIGS